MKIAFAEMLEVAAADGELGVKTKSGMTIFEVGAVAEKWREKILHPKTRAQKLETKAGNRVQLAGEFNADFLKELKVSKSVILPEDGTSFPEITFLAVDARRALVGFGKHAKKMNCAEALWVV